MEKVLVVVDMQNDFVTGSLGTEEAQSIVPAIAQKIKGYRGNVIATMDTHTGEMRYLQSQEGRYLPIPHCITGTDGWNLVPEIAAAIENKESDPFLPPIYMKSTFGCGPMVKALKFNSHKIREIEIVGVCTDICVISNALMIKANLPEVQIVVDSSCCAGSTPERHMAALEVMKSCQIKVVDGVEYQELPDNDIEKTPEMIEESGSLPF